MQQHGHAPESRGVGQGTTQHRRQDHRRVREDHRHHEAEEGGVQHRVVVQPGQRRAQPQQPGDHQPGVAGEQAGGAEPRQPGRPYGLQGDVATAVDHCEQDQHDPEGRQAGVGRHRGERHRQDDQQGERQRLPVVALPPGRVEGELAEPGQLHPFTGDGEQQEPGQPRHQARDVDPGEPECGGADPEEGTGELDRHRRVVRPPPQRQIDHQQRDGTDQHQRSADPQRRRAEDGEGTQ
ncbi:hypothetical protein SDC9_78776 [bioreactor metagenome]|uniref:Uncharacterized protein n=1 Tax=bioreactor metagenome TaxID=1076179 RepID=A0A644YUF7_9ZZZZ